MSATAAETVEPDGDAPEPPKKGRKKLIVIAAAAAVLLAGAGGGVAWTIKKKHAAEAASEAAAANDGEDAPVVAEPVHREVHKTPPSFLPLDAFVVNLADRDTERFAQVGITLELDEPKVADQLKLYMPAIRNGILMVLAHKSSQQLLTRAGKEKLAAEIMRESVRPLGIELEDDDDSRPAAKDEDHEPKTPLDKSPVRHVHFSSFIIQ